MRQTRASIILLGFQNVASPLTLSFVAISLKPLSQRCVTLGFGMVSYTHVLLLCVDTIMIFEHRLFMLLCVCSPICRKMLDIRAADMQRWRCCWYCQIYYPTLALSLCPRYGCDRPVLSDCSNSSPIESFTCSSWVFTDWDIWLCRDCLAPMTERILYPIEVDGAHRRVCYDCWSLRGRPSYVFVGGTRFYNRRTRRVFGSAFVLPIP